MTGGPGAGKTTLLDALQARGYRCVAESARRIIRERLACGLTPRPDAAVFARDVLDRDIANYCACPASAGPLLFDRGIVDALYLLHRSGAITRADAAQHIARYPYNGIVFALPPWREIYRTDAERDQSYEESVAVFQALTAWYRRWGYNVVEVPRETPAQRVDFVEAVMAGTAQSGPARRGPARPGGEP